MVVDSSMRILHYVLSLYSLTILIGSVRSEPPPENNYANSYSVQQNRHKLPELHTKHYLTRDIVNKDRFLSQHLLPQNFFASSNIDLRNNYGDKPPREDSQFQGWQQQASSTNTDSAYASTEDNYPKRMLSYTEDVASILKRVNDEQWEQQSQPSDSYGLPHVRQWESSDNSPPPEELQQPTETYGTPAKPEDTYGIPPKPDDTYGLPATPEDTYGLPSKPEDLYGLPKPVFTYGPAKPADTYGTPEEPSDTYGLPNSEPAPESSAPIENKSTKFSLFTQRELQTLNDGLQECMQQCILKL